MSNILKVRVEQFHAKNQFLIHTPEGVYFQSYNTVIAFKKKMNGYIQVYLDKDAWDYSHTTSKYRNLFLGEPRKETEKAIKGGVYVFANLNEES